VARRMLIRVSVNPSSRNVLVVVLVALGAVTGCSGRPLEVSHDGGAAGQGAAGQGGAGQGGDGGSAPDCGPNREAVYCPACNGGRVFAGCGVVGGDGTTCPNIDCSGVAPCADLPGETSCKSRSDCQELTCPDCQGGQTYVGCAAPGGAGAECRPCRPNCAGLDETTCAATPGCSAQNCSLCGPTVGGPIVFASCYRTGDSPAICPQPVTPLIVCGP
jgi:hypothetical protein